MKALNSEGVYLYYINYKGVMMKKFVIFMFVLLLASTFVFAQGAQQQTGLSDTVNEAEEVEDLNETDEEETDEEEDEETPEKKLERVRERLKEHNGAKDVAGLKEIVRLKSEELNLSIGQVEKQFTELNKNQNRVRLAVHALLAMENLTGGIGKNISAIAKEFDNSIEKTVRAEEKIAKRSRFTKFLVGGDREASEELNAEIDATQARFEELKQLREQCAEETDEETCGVLKEQFDELQQERARLREVAKEEFGSKGLFGWIWKRG